MDHNGPKSIRIFSSGKKPIILTREDKKRNAKKRQQLTKVGQTCPEEHSFPMRQQHSGTYKTKVKRRRQAWS